MTVHTIPIDWRKLELEFAAMTEPVRRYLDMADAMAEARTITVYCEAAVRAADSLAGITVQRPDGTVQRLSFTMTEAEERASFFQALAALNAHLAAADDTATSREAAVESNARQVIADLAAGRVGSQIIGDLTVAVGRAHRDAAAHRAINRGMERE